MSLQIPLQEKVVAGAEDEEGRPPPIPIPRASVQKTALQRGPIAGVHVQQGLEMWKASCRFVGSHAKPAHQLQEAGKGLKALLSPSHHSLLSFLVATLDYQSCGLV